MDSEFKTTIKNDLSSTSKLIHLLQRLLHDIWASPINLLLVALIVFLLVKLFLLKRKPSNDSSQKQTPIQLPKMPKCDLTIQELRGYNGIESNGRILTAIYGDIFDVSRRSDLYGIGTFSIFIKQSSYPLERKTLMARLIEPCVCVERKNHTLGYMLTRRIINTILEVDKT
jgi:hypothetical protein